MNEQWTAAFLPDEAVRRLRRAADRPETADTPYTIVEELGRGGMGTVYRAVDARLDREVALKVSTLGQADPEEAERMHKEARVMARLEHPGIVPVHDAGELPDGRMYYAMRLIRGERLDRWAEGRTLSDCLGVFRKVCEAVAFAHAHGVIHRDLKPANVMIGAFGEVLVLDWGVARRRGEPAEPQGTYWARGPIWRPNRSREGPTWWTSGPTCTPWAPFSRSCWRRPAPRARSRARSGRWRLRRRNASRQRATSTLPPSRPTLRASWTGQYRPLTARTCSSAWVGSALATARRFSWS